jgi:hypothetical protein
LALVFGLPSAANDKFPRDREADGSAARAPTLAFTSLASATSHGHGVLDRTVCTLVIVSAGTAILGIAKTVPDTSMASSMTTACRYLPLKDQRRWTLMRRITVAVPV